MNEWTLAVKEFKTKKSRETYRRVLDTAIELFSKKGFEKTTMRQISRAAELGLGALYYYFPSKESIIIAFYNEVQEELAAEWPEHDPGKEAELVDRLKAFLTFKLGKLETHRPLMRILLKEAVDPDSELSPFSSGSSQAKDKSLKIFESMVEAGENGARMARVLWLGHLALIGFWVHRPDRTQQAISTFAEMAPFLAYTMVSGGESGFFEQLLS